MSNLDLPGTWLSVGASFWRPRLYESFIKKKKKICFPGLFFLSAHTNQRSSNIILPWGYKLLTPLLLFSPFLFCRHCPSCFYVDTVEEQVNDTERQAQAERRGGRNLLLCCWAANVCVRKSSPGTKRAPSFVWRHLRPFLVVVVLPPLQNPTPLASFSIVRNPFIVFPLLLLCPLVYLKRFSVSRKKHLQNDKIKSISLTVSELSKTDQCARKTVFWSWRIAMVTIQPAVQKGLRTK